MHSIELREVTKHYGRRKIALQDLTWTPPDGQVTALLGPNGAGKTTLIKLVAGLHLPDSGEALTLGRPVAKLRRCEWEQIGYVSENQQLPLWMTVRQFFDYCRPLYPTWDRHLEAKLIVEMALPLRQKLSQLSRGQLMKAALVSSVSYRPRLLLLDEPFSGLDPLARDEFIAGLLELISGQDWTTLISSHDFLELERLAGHVAMLHEGRLRVNEGALDLAGRMKRVTLMLPESTALPEALPAHWRNVERSGPLVRFVDTRHDAEQVAAALPQAEIQDISEMSLRDIFVSQALEFRSSAS
jgi:ABC-2 type transport system ATP-binding protein